MTKMDEMMQAIRERDAAFENDDLDWARKMMPGTTSKTVVETGFHKARYMCTSVSDTKRLESQKYLASRGLTDPIGRPVRVGDPLER